MEEAVFKKTIIQDKMVDLLQAFTSFDDCQNVLEDLASVLSNAPDPIVVLLTLEGLYRIERDVDSGQFPNWQQDERLKGFRMFLRHWRCNSRLTGGYSGAFKRVPKILKGLTIFKSLEVPLFIDDYGKKELLSNYRGGIEGIRIDGSTPIYHVTHLEEAQKIVEGMQLKPSDKNNSIKGSWFGLESSPSVYGSRSFETTLSQLGVTGLHQGEIVSYKQEVNVILYAADDTYFRGLKKPTNKAVKDVHDPGAYVKVSIFVPARFLPSQEEFLRVFSGPDEVQHGPFCVRGKRLGDECQELSVPWPRLG